MSNHVKEALEGIEPGSEVSLRLADGTSVSGVFRGTRDDAVRLADAEDVDLDNVVDVGRRRVTEGLE